jgi:hypothetical protein
MGMDVFGVAPKSEAGKYFRANIWSWRPIHELIEKANVLPPHIVEGMAFNDGYGPNEQESLLLAAALENMLDGMDDEHTFMLSDEVDGPVAALLSALNDRGVEIVSPRGPVYQAEVSHVREFIEFCRESGGFEVC